MPPHGPKQTILAGSRGLTLQAADRPVLERWARSQALSHRQVQRARMLLGLAEGRTLAALDLDTGKVYYADAKRHRHQACLAFLRQWARRFPTQRVHPVLDHYSPHKHRKVKSGRKAHPRFHFHVTPTACAWLNPVEHWFSALQRQGLARGSFADVADLRATLGRYVRGRNRRAAPPPWNTRADELLARIAQIRRTCGMVH